MLRENDLASGCVSTVSRSTPRAAVSGSLYHLTNRVWISRLIGALQRLHVAPAASDTDFEVPWSLKMGDLVIFRLPRAVVVRQHVSHLIHHRGQLSVYLRLVDVPIPSIYGPTADEPWGGSQD